MTKTESPDYLISMPCGPIRGTVCPPGDKSISHRAAILGGLAHGTTLVSNFLCSEDCVNTLKAMQSMGCEVEVLEERANFGPTKFRIHGCRGKLSCPETSIDCGNSGTGMRLLAGVLAAQPFDSKMIGDESLSGRPMGRIITPLAKMGAKIEACGENPGCAPLKITGTTLQAIDYELPMASAQVKSAVLLAGLFAAGTTRVKQPAVTRDHTEKLFSHFGIKLNINELSMTLTGPAVPIARDLEIPGDISSAAFWLVAAAAKPGSELIIKNVGLNPTRTAIIEVLKRMGADIEVMPTNDSKSIDCGELTGNLRVRGTRLKGTALLPEEIPNLIDEIPILAVAGALASGTTEIRNARELRVKETDRITTVVKNLRTMGVEVTEHEDGMTIFGKTHREKNEGNLLQSAEIESFGDHRIAMSFLIAGLFTEGTTRVSGTDCINTSYPGFSDDFKQLTK